MKRIRGRVVESDLKIGKITENIILSGEVIECLGIKSSSRSFLGKFGTSLNITELIRPSSVCYQAPWYKVRLSSGSNNAKSRPNIDVC